jgi:hypothetical protein
MSKVAVEVNVYSERFHERVLEITGSNLNETRTIHSRSEIIVTGSNCTITFDIPDSATVVSIFVEGKSNFLIVDGGQSRIKIAGRNNTVDATNSRILSEDSTGSSNFILDT